MAVRNLVDTIRDTLHQEMARDPRIVVLGEDVGVAGGVFRATAGLLSAFGEHRVIDTPLAESGIVGVAIGLSLNGMVPVAEIQFADFIHSALDQLISEAARIRYRSNGDFYCPLVVRVPYGGAIHGGLYHSQSVEALFAHVPGLRVVAPSTPYDAAGMLRAAIRCQDPVIFLEHKAVYRLVKEEVPDEEYTVPLDRAAVRKEGSRLTLLTYGLMLHHSLAVAQELEREGVSVEVIDLRSLAPLDKETILGSVRKTGRALIVHEDNLTGGLGGEVAAIIVQEAFDSLDAPVTRLAGEDVPAFPFAPPLEEAAIPNREKILAAIQELAAY
ncbi:MAG: alpha-ketoacid dehydrogenase subunit beta [Chloroflexi bacterium]|nr:alpha-ketoacid dehydrogenase subunit beta [Chloroflexota bacterium]